MMPTTSSIKRPKDTGAIAPSALSHFSCRVDRLQRSPGVVDCAWPIDTTLLGGAGVVPRGGVLAPCLAGRKTPAQATRPRHGPSLVLGHVQPPAGLGRVTKPQASSQRSRLLRRNGPREGAWRLRVPRIADPPALCGCRLARAPSGLTLWGPGSLGAPGTPRALTPARPRCAAQEAARRACPRVCGVPPARRLWRAWAWLARCLQPRERRRVPAPHGQERSGGPGGDGQPGCPVRHARGGGGRGDAPRRALPRRPGVFCRVRRRVAGRTDSAIARAPAGAARRRRGPLATPGGGGPRRQAISWASGAPSRP